MDFITLATETNTRQLLRQLTDVLGDDDGTMTVLSNQESAEDTDVPSKPLLSKAAEAELYLLATNFLLYVAMVIIATMVAKIYFPESLERSGSPTQRARSFSYRMAERAKEEEEYYGSDAEDEDDGDGEDEMEVLDSDDEEETKVLRRPAVRKRSSFFLDEFEEESLTKTQVLKRLLFCSVRTSYRLVSCYETVLILFN